MKITKIDKEACKIIRAELDAVITAKLAEFGLEGGLGNGRFDPTLVSFKCEVKLAGSPSLLAKRQVEDLENWVKWKSIEWNVPTDDIKDRTYHAGTETFRLVGYSSKASKYPLIMEDVVTFQKYKFSENLVEKVFTAGVAS